MNSAIFSMLYFYLQTYRECTGHRTTHATRDNYLLPTQNEISPGALSKCSFCQSQSVWSGMQAASLPLLCICFWAPCTPSLHSLTRSETHSPPSLVPCMCRLGAGTCSQPRSSSSSGCAPCPMVSCCYSYWSWNLHKDTELFLHRSWGRVWQLQCNSI